MAWTHFAQQRLRNHTLLFRDWAAGVKAAARRRLGRTGQITRKDNPLAAHFILWVWNGDSRKQCLRVWVEWGFIQLLPIR
jgi:hypothetical protein